MNKKTNKIQIIKARSTQDGAGAQIKRVFPGFDLPHNDPFVLLDEFFVTPEASFPEHPHRGFEAITYMLEGGFRHKDNLGNDSVVSARGAQRFTAGKVIRHAELPATKNMNHGLQLWINLPQKLKNIDPNYQKVDASNFPESDRKGIKIRTIVGPNSPLKLKTAINFLDISLENDKEFNYQIPDGWNGLIYILENELHYQEAALTTGHAIILKNGGIFKVKTKAPARFALIIGKPHNQPIRLQGSFVL
ncbi:MAG TPA: pirin family protein [bacterium]|nr:pirin family protein [bacterium]